MQKEVKIKTKDKKVVYGTLDTVAKSKGLIIFVHGLGGHKNEHIFFNAVKYFNNKNYDTFRVDLYSGEKGSRTFSQSTLTTHNQDVDAVVNKFKNQYKNIFLIGHSLGGLSIIKANLKPIKGLILWDSTYNLRKVIEDENAKFIKELNAYLVNWGMEILMGKEMVDEWIHFPSPKELAKNITIPIKVICAGKGKLIKAGKEYYINAAGPKEFALIKNAGHNFNEPNTAEDLYKETYSFIKKFS